MAQHTPLLNANIPDAVRQVADNPNKLRLALIDLSAQYKNAITLGRGDPDLATPPHIVDAANAAMLSNTPTQG